MPDKTTHLYAVYSGADLEEPVYRIVPACPPTTLDFMSYEQLGIVYDRRDYFRGIGTSMYTTRRQAVRAARRYRRGTSIAQVDLRDNGITWARTGGRHHLTVWAPPEILARRVLECDEL